jgi:hypothetical protein
MKKYLLTTIVMAIVVFNAYSQSGNFRAFKLDLSMGYASPASPSNSTSGGISFTFHPHYRLADEFAVGLRIEAAMLAYSTASAADDYSLSDSKVAILNSYCLTGEYYLSNGSFRPFIGGGAGIFTQSSIQVINADNTVNATLQKSKIGAFPAVGFEWGHFRMSGDYNFLPDNAGYLGIKVGVFIGGGRKGTNSYGGGRGRGGAYLNWEG